MLQLLTELGERMALRNVKKNQHYIDMDGYHVFYEGIGSRKGQA